VGGGGPEGELRPGHGVRELLACVAKRASGPVVTGQGLVRVCAGDERCSIVPKGGCAVRGRCLQVGEVLDLTEELVEDGTLNELAEVLPLEFAFVDAQLAAESRLQGLEPKQDRDLARSGKAGAGGAIEGPPLVRADCAREVGGEE
jgi:hypothetical protein